MCYKISVISLTWNSRKHIKPFLSSLLLDLEQSNIKYEIIIVDNGSTDNTLSEIKLFDNKYLKVIPLGRNTGTTFSRNIALKMALGEYVFILDSDVEIPLGTVNKLLDSYLKINSDKIGIIHPKLIYPDGTFQESARKFPTILSKLYRLFEIDKLRIKQESYTDVLQQNICKVDYAISAAWFLKNDIFKEIGYLDEKIFYAPEDAEFCARLNCAGYEVWYYPIVTVIHNCQRITKKRPLTKLGFSHVKGLIYFWKKYIKIIKH